MNYKMVFSDMDGTLLWKGIRISVENQNAIQKIIDKDIDFVICTGRGVFGVEPHLRQLGLIGRKGFVICQNGASIYNLESMTLIRKRGFSPALLAPVANFAREMGGVELFYYDERTFLCERISDEVREYCKVMKTTPRCVKSPTDYSGELTKCLFSGPRKKLEQIKIFAEKLLGDQVNLFYSAENYLEFVVGGVDKGSAMAAAAQAAGVELKDTIAIGDSDNDLTMIQQAGLGVAMANGEIYVKEAADYITERNAEENGVAEVLERFILNEMV